MRNSAPVPSSLMHDHIIVLVQHSVLPEHIPLMVADEERVHHEGSEADTQPIPDQPVGSDLDQKIGLRTGEKGECCRSSTAIYQDGGLSDSFCAVVADRRVLMAARDRECLCVINGL